ncbi:MAG TPA: class F sortase [Candidatus Dormibacteraeota bacterium]
MNCGTLRPTVRLPRRSAAVIAIAVGAGAALLPLLPSLAAPSSWLAIDGNIRFTSPSGVTFDWANSGAASPVPGCPAGTVNVTGAGGLFNCGSPGVASAPPNPPSLTPAAAADPTRISSAFIVDPLSSDTTSCGAGDPTTFRSSVKNGDPINGIAYGPGNVPNKDDLSDVYAVSHATANRPELFFGAERLTDNGDSHIDFEFLQSIVGLSGGCSGSFTGHRTQGDLLVAVDFTGGGAAATNALYQWHCNAEPGQQPADGTVCDPGGTAHYQQIAVPGSLAFTVNASAVPCGGWVCRNATGVTAQIATNDFLEGGIDLTVLNFTSCFHTFLPHTRTAQSFTAALTDFAGPAPLTTCRTPNLSTGSTPSGFNLSPGVAASDRLTARDPAGMATPQGTAAFFLCSPGLVSSGGCSGGNAVGAVKTLVSGTATSDTTTATTALGTYCWRAVYTPTGASLGLFDTATESVGANECFTVGIPGAPNAGRGVEQPMPPPAFVNPADNEPVRIQIRRIGLDIAVETVGLDSHGQMAVPASLGDAGWFGGGTIPGSKGNAVMTGHLDGSSSQPAAFWLLGDLRAGDQIIVTTADGSDLRFLVTAVDRYPVGALPLLKVFGPSSQPHLNLITCAGRFNPAAGYSQRLVAYTTLLG